MKQGFYVEPQVSLYPTQKIGEAIILLSGKSGNYREVKGHRLNNSETFCEFSFLVMKFLIYDSYKKRDTAKTNFGAKYTNSTMKKKKNLIIYKIAWLVGVTKY